jgi:hypothetical protein
MNAGDGTRMNLLTRVCDVVIVVARLNHHA